MLENINLKRKLSREDYKQALPVLQQRLYDLEKACWDHGVPTIIVFEGWDASGKGTAIAALTQRLDPRGFKLYPITAPRTYEQQRPWLWRFWLRVPNRGEMVIFDRSWYFSVLEQRVEQTISEKAWRSAYRDIVDFERMLADDGAVILKFFLHISKKEQKARFRAIEADRLEAWRVTAADWGRHKKYDRYVAVAEEMHDRRFFFEIGDRLISCRPVSQKKHSAPLFVSLPFHTGNSHITEFPRRDIAGGIVRIVRNAEFGGHRYA